MSSNYTESVDLTLWHDVLILHIMYYSPFFLLKMRNPGQEAILICDSHNTVAYFLTDSERKLCKGAGNWVDIFPTASRLPHTVCPSPKYSVHKYPLVCGWGGTRGRYVSRDDAG